MKILEQTNNNGVKVFGKIVKYTVKVGLLLTIFAITTLAIFLEPAVKIRGFVRLSPEKLTTPQYTVTILDNNENPIDQSNMQYTYTQIALVPQITRDAFISVEDKRFYSHNGIDVVRVLSALQKDLAAGSFQEGASTITQQLVKNTHLTSDKTIRRKLQEMRIAREIERKYSKDEILELYLNMLCFGNNLYGIGTASKAMFQKDVSELNLEESALLAGIINNPTRFNPYTNPEKTKMRRDLVLSRMYEQKKITKDEYEATKSKNIYVMSDIVKKNSYFQSVLQEAMAILNCSDEEFRRHHYVIGTGFEADFQSLVEQVMGSVTLPDSVLTQVIVLDNTTGKILTLLGDTNIRRQPGSTVKPFLAYAPAIEQKIAFPASPILDRQTSFSDYTPSNYQDCYSGWTTVEDALITSSNICAVKLLEMTGVEHAKNFARRIGIDFAASDNGLPLALGGMEQGLTLQSVAGAYQAFANNGNYIESNFIRYIKDQEGTIIYRRNALEKQVMSDTTAYFINKMLAKCAHEGTARRLDGAAPFVCAKTGTVGDEHGNTDAYCIAYTPEYTVAVWIGSKDNTVPHNITGGGTPAIIAREILQKIAPKNSTGYHRPDSVKTVDLDLLEYNQNHRLIMADDSLLPRYRKTAEFPMSFIPQKKLTVTPYLGGQSQSFNQMRDQKKNESGEPFYFQSNDPPSILDPKNYEIVA